MKSHKKTLIPLLLAVIGICSATLFVGCARTGEIDFTEGVDRSWVKKGDKVDIKADGVVLSDRAFAYYSKGCR